METRAQARKEKEVMEDPLGLRMEKLENKIAEQNQKLDKSFAQLIDTIRLISVKVNNASSSGHLQQQRSRETVYPSSEVFHVRRTGTNSNYSAVTRSSKLDFHRFSGDRVRDWLFKLEQFFSLDFTPEELMVSIASTLCDGAAAKWYKSLFESDFGVKLLSNWNMYKLLLEEHFAEVLDDPISELKQLKETNGIEEYHKKFELLRARVNLSEDYLVRVYLDGLHPDTQMNVNMFQPQTVCQCLLVGRLYEQVHQKILIIRKVGEDSEKGAPTLNVPNEVAGPSLSNIHVHDALHKDRECFEGKHSIQGTTAGMENFMQQEELNCDRDCVFERDHWCAPYVNLETKLVNQEKSELCTGNEGEVKGCLEVSRQKVSSTFADLDKDDATTSQLRSPFGFVVDDLPSGCGSDNIRFRNSASPLVVGDSQKTPWILNEESNDIQNFQIAIDGSSNFYAGQESNGMRLRSHILTQQKRPSKSPKSWKFKFKISNDSKLRYIKFWCEKVSSKKKLKCGKFWKFHYKNKFICKTKMFPYKKRLMTLQFMGKIAVDMATYEDVYVSSFKKSHRCRKRAMIIVVDLSFDLGVTDGYIGELAFGQVNYFDREEFVKKLQAELDISVREQINQSWYLRISRKEAEEKCYTYLQWAKRVWVTS
jgi:hypothetical protein